MSHTIRLRGPWEIRILETADGAESPVDFAEGHVLRLNLPAPLRIVGASFRGRARFDRSFGTPSGLGPSERVWLVIDTPHQIRDASINGEPAELERLGAESNRWRADITGRLGRRNTLSLTLAYDGQPRSEQAEPLALLGEVTLEIRG